MFAHWEVDAGIALGLASVILGIVIRAGGARPWLRYYFVSELPPNLRNGGLALIPCGLLFLLVIAGAGMVAQMGQKALPLGSLLVVLAFCDLPIMVWWLNWPPDFIKPAWIKRPQDPMAGAMRPRPMARSQYRVTWLILLAGAAGWLALAPALRLPPGPAFYFLGVGVPLLYGVRPDRPS